MRKHSASRLAAVSAGLCALTLQWACGGGSTPSSPSTSSPTPSPVASSTPLPSLDVMLADKVLGNPAAGVALIEYSSLTCPHCASFHKSTLPQIETAYITPGKVMLVYRDFPLDEAALSAAMIARCSGERYFAVLDLLFDTQGSWAGSADTVGALKTAVAPAGLSSTTVDACLARADLRSGILRIQATGQSDYGVRATPTFIVGGQTIVGALPFADFDAILKRLTSG